MDEPNNNKKLNITLGSVVRMPIVRQVIFLAGMGASIAFGMYIFSEMKDPNFRPINYQVTQKNISSIIDTLDKAGIKYKINTNDGVLYVDAAQAQNAKIKLQSAGVPRDDSISFDYLNQEGNIGNSEFIENARYLRALESDLSKTISGIDGISNAKVHIAIPQGNIFADENQHPSAAIVVTMANGMSFNQEKIRAIVGIVASSVPGLDEKYVSITDQAGHFLSGALSDNLIYNSQQMNYQNSLQNDFEKRILTMIAPLIGDNKVNVRVYANIDFTQNEEANEKYNPAETAVRSEQTVSESDSSSGASGAPGSLSNSPEEGGPKSQASSGTSSGKSQSTKHYEVSKTVTYKKSVIPKIVNLSVAVVIDNQKLVDAKTKNVSQKPIDKDTLAKINELVKSTIGFNGDRGDKVTVVNSNFDGAQDNLPVVKPALWEQPWFWDVIQKSITGVLGLIILFFSTKKLFNYIKTNTQASAGAGGNEMGMTLEGGITPEMQQLKYEQINRLKELASKDPGRVSVIIKSWVDK